MGSSITTLVAQEVPWYAPGQTDYFSHRLSYNMQLVIGRKFSEGLSLQITPGVIHRNLTAYSDDKNDVMNIGIGGRVKLSKRVAFSAEYFYVLPDQMHEYSDAEVRANPNLEPTNSLSVGFDIETGGHVFQLHFTNSTGMFERAFITETNNHWYNRDIIWIISLPYSAFPPKKKVSRTQRSRRTNPWGLVVTVSLFPNWIGQIRQGPFSITGYRYHGQHIMPCSAVSLIRHAGTRVTESVDSNASGAFARNSSRVIMPFTSVESNTTMSSSSV